MPTLCELRDGETSCPSYLTEADLVTLMDKNGIGASFHDLVARCLYSSGLLTGTDATIAQHIQTIVDREYVLERMEGATKYLVPSTLGIGLIEGYNQIGFERSLSKPQLRREVRPSNFSVFVLQYIEQTVRRRGAWFKYARARRRNTTCSYRASNNIRICSSGPRGSSIKSFRSVQELEAITTH